MRWHGTLNSHIVGGYVPSGTVNGVNFDAFPHADASLFHYGRGMAPFVKIGSSVIFDFDFTFPNYETLERMAYNDSARISSNSWGAAVGGAYNADSQRTTPWYATRITKPQATRSTQFFHCRKFRSWRQTVVRPAQPRTLFPLAQLKTYIRSAARTVVALPTTGADSANDMIAFSSRGPCDDGRKKPEIVGPGTHDTGGVFQASLANPPGSGNGAAAGLF